MRVSKSVLENAAQHGLLEPHQVQPLLNFFEEEATGPRFDMTHVLYYLGGLIAIGALSLFMNLGWEQFGGWGIFFICLLYAAIAFLAANRLRDAGRHIPAGISAAFVVALTPLAIYGVQQGMGWWPDQSVYENYHRFIGFLWIYMELGALLAGILILWRYRYPFLVMPIAATLWYLSMDITELVLSIGDAEYSFDIGAAVSMWFGLAMILVAFWVDLRSRKSMDFAFWLYLFGVITFWGGLTQQDSDSELARFGYCCINLLLIGIGVVLVRKVFVIFGAFGVCFYLGYLASQVFQDSWLFPVALTVIGAGVVYLGVIWQKYEDTITARARALLPQPVAELLNSRQL